MKTRIGLAVCLTVLSLSDLLFEAAAIRLALLELTLGMPPSEVHVHPQNVNTGEAIRQFTAGDRALKGGTLVKLPEFTIA